MRGDGARVNYPREALICRVIGDTFTHRLTISRFEVFHGGEISREGILIILLSTRIPRRSENFIDFN